MASARHYVLTVLVLLATLSAAAIAFNAHVDPYSIDAAKAGNVGQARERAGALHRKVAHARHANAGTVLLGTSRVQSGLPIDHPAFGERHRPVVNLALGAASMEQTRLLLIHAHTSSPLRAAIVGLDFEAFLGAGRPDFDPRLLAGNPESLSPALTWLRTNVSRDTVWASVRQRWGIGRATEVERLDAPAAIDDPSRQNDSQRSIVWATEFWNFNARLPLLFPAPVTQSAWLGVPQRRAEIAAFGELLRFARRENIELHLFISPVHARYLDWYRRVGWWQPYEAWKRALAAEIDREAGEHRDRIPFTLWDMSGFRGPASEPVPRLSDTTTRMQWYLETSHYSDKLGARILDILLGAAAPDETWPVTRIDTQTLDSHLRRLYQDADAWREMHHGETTNVAAMVGYMRRHSRR